MLHFDFTLFFYGLLGLIFHILIKIRSTSKRQKSLNLASGALDFFINEFWNLVIDFAALIITVFLTPFLQTWLDSVKVPFKLDGLAFFFVGYTGSSILLQYISVTDKITNKISDVKSNIADNVPEELKDPTPPANEPQK